MKAAKFVVYLILLQTVVYFTMRYLFSLSDPLTAVDTNTFIPMRILTSSALKTTILILDLIFSCCYIFQIWDSFQQAGLRHRKSKTT